MPRMRTLLTSAVAVAATLGLAGTSLTAADAAPSDHARAAKPAKNKNATKFAMKGWGYGTSVSGGDLPTASAPTAFEIIGCNNRVGINRTNNVADANLPSSLGTIEGVKTRVWTNRSGKVVSQWARNSISKVTLSDNPALGTLTLSAIESTARAYHDGKRFRSSTNTDLAKLVFKPVVGPAQTLELPKPNDPVEIPGFAKVTVVQSGKRASATGAGGYTNGLRVDLFASHSKVQIAHAAAQIDLGLKSGIFTGESYGVSGKAGGDIVHLGRNPLVKMPCTGTGGKVRTRTLSGTDLGGGQAVANEVRSQQMAKQTKTRAWGFERSRVASLELGGNVTIHGIIGQVNVSRSGLGLRKLVTSTKGTSIGSVVVNGESQELPLNQTMEIPGVAKLQPRVVTKLPNGLKVTALRITLLDGSGAVIDLGTAILQVRPVKVPKG